MNGRCSSCIVGTATAPTAGSRVVGGAPIYVSSWVPCGGVQPMVAVHRLAITLAGTGGDLDHLNAPAASPPDPC